VRVLCRSIEIYRDKKPADLPRRTVDRTVSRREAIAPKSVSSLLLGEPSTYYVLITRAYYFPRSTRTTYIRPVFVAGYPPRACIEMCRRIPAKYDAGKERWDYLNTVVPRVSCDPPGGSRWSPLGSAGPPRTRPSRRVTYGGHPHVELPPSSLRRTRSPIRQKGPSNRLFEYRSIAFASG